MNKELQYLFNVTCPFSHRGWITLLEKDCDFEPRPVSLKDKEPFFTQTYLKAFAADQTCDGKTPVLVDGENVFCESDLVAWYVAEKFKTGNQLIPEDPVKNLKMKWFASAMSGKIMSTFFSFRGYPKKSEEDKEKVKENAHKLFEELDKILVLPYAMGEQFSLADVFCYPFLARWIVVSHYVKFPIDPKYSRVHEWINNIEQRPAVKATKQEDEVFIEAFASYYVS